MAQIALKYPLEKMQPYLLVWLQIVIARILRAQSLVDIIIPPIHKHRNRTFKIKPKPPVIAVKQHHGAVPLLLDFNSSRYQEVLAAAIVWARGKGKARSETPAIFIQKIREWTDINKSKGAADPRPYRSYQEWCDHNFPAQNFESIQRVIESLETMGLLVTEQDPEQSFKKRFAVNEEAVRELVERWAAAHPEIAAHFRGTPIPRKIESPRLDPPTPRLDRESERLAIESHKAVKKESIQFSKKGDTPPHPAAATRFEPPALTDENKEVDSDSHADAVEPIGQSNATDESGFAGPIPHSEAPLTQIDETAAQVWDMARDQLSNIDAMFKRWLQEATLRRFMCIDGIATYAVAVSSLQAKEMLQRRYYRNVERVFKGLQNAPVKIEFEVGI